MVFICLSVLGRTEEFGAFSCISAEQKSLCRFLTGALWGIRRASEPRGGSLNFDLEKPGDRTGTRHNLWLFILSLFFPTSMAFIRGGFSALFCCRDGFPSGQYSDTINHKINSHVN